MSVEKELSMMTASETPVIDHTHAPTRSLADLENKQLCDNLLEVLERLRVALTTDDHPVIEHQVGNVLFIGPSSINKIHAAEAVANHLRSQVKFSFLPINGYYFRSHLPDLPFGSSACALEAVFQWANDNSPTLIFINQFETVATRSIDCHREIMYPLLSRLAGENTLENIALIGATSRPQLIDPAIKQQFGDNVVQFIDGSDDARAGH